MKKLQVLNLSIGVFFLGSSTSLNHDRGFQPAILLASPILGWAGNSTKLISNVAKQQDCQPQLSPGLGSDTKG